MKIFDITNKAHQQILAEEIIRAKRILAEQTDETAPKLSASKIYNWMQDNRDLIGSFTFEGQDLSTILKFLQTGRPSQYYLKLLIDKLDLIENVAIDDADFYVSTKSADNGTKFPSYGGAQAWVDSERAAGRTSGLD